MDWHGGQLDSRLRGNDLSEYFTSIQNPSRMLARPKEYNVLARDTEKVDRPNLVGGLEIYSHAH